MKRLLLGLILLVNFIQADSFEEKMLARAEQIQSIPQNFGKKEFADDTWLFNLVDKNCPDKIGVKRTKCILKNRKTILAMWDKRDNSLVKIAKQNKDKIVWIGRQTFIDLDAIVEAKIDGKNKWSSKKKIPKGYRLPTLKEITKACYDKNLRNYFYGSTTGYGEDSFRYNFDYAGKKNMYLDFKTCKPIYLKNRYETYRLYGLQKRWIIATKYVKKI